MLGEKIVAAEIYSNINRKKLDLGTLLRTASNSYYYDKNMQKVGKSIMS